MTRKLSLLLPAHLVEEVSEWIWNHWESVEGIQEAPASGESLFQIQKGFEILEFGSEAAKKAARWLESDAYRGKGNMTLFVFISSDIPAAQLAAQLEPLKSRFPDADCRSIEELEAKDYLEEYKKSVRGSEVGKSLWVGPPWDEAWKTSGRTPLIVEPGLAFGTGEHPTTQMILERIEELAALMMRPLRIWDLGAGTGVLGLAAKKLFKNVSFLLLSDLDPLCSDEIAKTFGQNNVAIDPLHTVVECGHRGTAEYVAGHHAKFDIVISNIYAEVLADLAPAVCRAMAADGLWLCSGILEGESENILEQKARQQFTLRERRAKKRSSPVLNSEVGMQNIDECWVFREYGLK